MTALLRSSLPLVGSGHKHAAQRPQVPRQKRGQGGEQVLPIDTTPHSVCCRCPSSRTGAHSKPRQAPAGLKQRLKRSSQQRRRALPSVTPGIRLRRGAAAFAGGQLAIPCTSVAWRCIPSTAGVRTQGLKQDLTAALADLEALDTQLAQATQQLGAEQTKNETERHALSPDRILCRSSA